MKKIALFCIIIYQTLISSMLKSLIGIDRMCRFTPTCSDYAKQQIREQGVLNGSVRALKRILRCQPFTRPAHL